MKAVESIKNLINAISSKTKLSKKLMLVLALFFFGLAALLVSELKTQEPQAAQSTTQPPEELSAQEYAEQLENRLISIISAIDGVGEVKVMVTLESGTEEVYLYNSDYAQNNRSGDENSFEQNMEHVIIGEDGQEQGIVVRVIEPKVRGVAVVCGGAGSDTVRERIIQTVTALLDISSARVSVVESSE